MNPIISILWIIMSPFQEISNSSGVVVRNLGKQLVGLCNSIKNYVKDLLVDNKTFSISSGKDFNKNWKIFKTNIRNELSQLNIKSKSLKLIEDITNGSLKNNFNQNLGRITKNLEIQIWDNIKCIMGELATKEMENIIKDLKGESFFNLSGSNMKKELADYIKLGKKFTPFCKVNVKQELELFENEVTKIINQLAWRESRFVKTKNIFARVRILQKTSRVKNNPEISMILSSILKSYKKERVLFKNQLRTRNINYGNLVTKQEIEEIFKPNSNQILVAADKNVGYVCMDKSDLLEQYVKINEKQHFGKTDISEDWYIKNIMSYLKQASENIPDELANIISQGDFKWTEHKPEIGTLRLMPKILKLKVISKENVKNLNSRGIKSSMRDPLKMIQKTLDKIYSHLLYFIETEFWRLHGKLSPSVTGIDEAIERIKKSHTGDWGESLELEGDFGDLYSNCNKDLLEECLKESCKLAKLSSTSVEYILNLMSVSMNHSYFKEPSGIYKTLKGFSMGDNSAARGSEIILRIFELKIFKKLQKQKLHKNVKRYLRFRDDVSLHLTGDTETMLKIVKIITTGYPDAIQFNVETKIIYGKFLNIKIFNNPLTTKPITTVLRKSNSKYDIIPFNSNVSQKYKKMAGLCYFKTNRSHTTSKEELSRQNQIVFTILKEKGFPLKFIKKLAKKPKNKEIKEKKKFTGVTIFDNVSMRHKFVKNVLNNSTLNKDQYYLPAEIPGTKLEQFIFTIKKMKEQLNF